MNGAAVGPNESFSGWSEYDDGQLTLLNCAMIWMRNMDARDWTVGAVFLVIGIILCASSEVSDNPLFSLAMAPVRYVKAMYIVNWELKSFTMLTDYYTGSRMTSSGLLAIAGVGTVATKALMNAKTQGRNRMLAVTARGG